MKRIGKILKTTYIIVTALALILSLTAATYAWFSTNTVVETTRASGRSNVENVMLLLSSTSGGTTNGSTEAAITKVNTADELMPVSTADLRQFVTNRVTNEDSNAVIFEKVENEKYIYHGRIYVQAVATNAPENARLALFLDEDTETGGKLLQNMSKYVINAARLGVMVNNANPIIMKFGDDRNPDEGYINNTVVDGQVLDAGNVVVFSNDKITAVKDPAVQYSDYLVSSDGSLSTGMKPIQYLELNKEYTIDVFFYIEGCDPDCTDIIELSNLDFHLGFYGIYTEEVL